MVHKCHDCFYKTDWEDDTGHYPICERMHIMSFEDAKTECAKPAPCHHFLSHKEANIIIDKFNSLPLENYG